MPETGKLWPCLAGTDGSALPDRVRLWVARLQANPKELAEPWSMLSAEERERANRFAFERDRVRFVMARAVLRTLLGSRLGLSPNKVEFTYSTTGKPSLGGDLARLELQFNLAHSADLALFAATDRGAVGVDVEQIRPMPDMSDVSERFFSAHECDELKKLPVEARVELFFRIWTRKEAWLKATGEGITGPLRSVEVLPGAGGGAMSAVTAVASAGMRLQLYDLAPAPGFVGALAITLENSTASPVYA
jgi:4'-phosphopantetheinyl transferase